jgi:penicillin-binding protein 1C
VSAPRRGLWLGFQACCSLVVLAELVLLVAVVAFPYPVELLEPSRGGPLLVEDRHGNLLASLPGARGPARERWVSLDRIPSHALLTLIASEDARFFEHRGVDPVGIARAAWLNLRGDGGRFGGSTITMQLVRMVHSEGRPRTLSLKLHEAVLALRLERALDKRAILEQYLNRAPFGNGAHGIEAAARTYFGKPAASLSVGEATLLAVLPRGPSLYDPLRHEARALRRRAHLLALLVARGAIGREEAARASAQRLALGYHAPPFLAPHFVRYAVSTLPEEVRRQGGTLRTTLDLPLQTLLERRLAEHVAALRAERLGQAGLVVLDTESGEVRAMVGSAGFDSEAGQVNIVTRRRHPGSVLKPFVYALALEAGDTPATIALDIHDVPSRYRVRRVTQPERGPVRYREALAGSYNLAAVHVLERVTEARLVTRLREAGVGPLAGGADAYGLRLALGAAKVRLLDLASAYGFLAREGRVVPPLAVREVRNADGRLWEPPPRGERQLFSREVAWQAMDMLADPEARRPAFGEELPLDLPFAVAAKTGTARGFADTVAIGVTRELTAAAWAGNFDGKATHGLVAMESAAPLVREALLVAGEGRALSLPPRPATLRAVTVCPLSGAPATAACPSHKREHVAPGQRIGEPCTWHRREGDRVTIIYPPEVRPWLARRHLARHL